MKEKYDYGRTILIIEAEAGNLEVVRILLDAGANPQVLASWLTNWCFSDLYHSGCGRERRHGSGCRQGKRSQRGGRTPAISSEVKEYR